MSYCLLISTAVLLLKIIGTTVLNISVLQFCSTVLSAGV